MLLDLWSYYSVLSKEYCQESKEGRRKSIFLLNEIFAAGLLRIHFPFFQLLTRKLFDAFRHIDVIGLQAEVLNIWLLNGFARERYDYMYFYQKHPSPSLLSPFPSFPPVQTPFPCKMVVKRHILLLTSNYFNKNVNLTQRKSTCKSRVNSPFSATQEHIVIGNTHIHIYAYS